MAFNFHSLVLFLPLGNPGFFVSPILHGRFYRPDLNSQSHPLPRHMGQIPMTILTNRVANMHGPKNAVF